MVNLRHSTATRLAGYEEGYTIRRLVANPNPYEELSTIQRKRAKGEQHSDKKNKGMEFNRLREGVLYHRHKAQIILNAFF